MAIKIGTTDFSNFYNGSSQIQRIMLGTNILWQAFLYLGQYPFTLGTSGGRFEGKPDWLDTSKFYATTTTSTSSDIFSNSFMETEYYVYPRLSGSTTYYNRVSKLVINQKGKFRIGISGRVYNTNAPFMLYVNSEITTAAQISSTTNRAISVTSTGYFRKNVIVDVESTPYYLNFVTKANSSSSNTIYITDIGIAHTTDEAYLIDGVSGDFMDYPDCPSFLDFSRFSAPSSLTTNSDMFSNGWYGYTNTAIPVEPSSLSAKDYYRCGQIQFNSPGYYMIEFLCFFMVDSQEMLGSFLSVHSSSSPLTSRSQIDSSVNRLIYEEDRNQTEESQEYKKITFSVSTVPFYINFSGSIVVTSTGDSSMPFIGLFNILKIS